MSCGKTATMLNLISLKGAIQSQHLELLEYAHTIDRAVELLSKSEDVVHCEDCVYWTDAKVNKKGFLICPQSGMEIYEQDYCSYSERREK